MMSTVNLVNLVDKYKDSNYIETLGPLLLATILKNNTNHNIKFIDFQHEDKSINYNKKNDFDTEMERLYTFVMANSPDLVSFYTMCGNYHLCIAVAKLIKERCPNVKVVFGGPQATLTAHDTIKTIEWIDAIGIGEGENTIVEIVEGLLNDRDLSQVKGIVFKKNGEVIDTGMPDLIEDLDNLPFIDYSFLKMDNIDVVNIDVGRGCPFNCTFCSTKIFWKRKFRLKSPKRIIEEIKLVKEKYNINYFALTHDLFTANKRKIMKFCQMLISENLNISWSCSSRVDTLDEEMVENMRLAGCSAIFLGIETGSPRMQKIINKNLNVNKVIPLVKLLKNNGIDYKLSFIYGFPEETIEDINLTLNLINQLLKNKLVMFNSIEFHELTFFPGSELTQKYSTDFVITDKINTTMVNKPQLPLYLEEIIENNKIMFSHYYDFQHENKDEIDGLNRFILLVYMRTLPKFKLTYKLLMEYFNDDLFRLFTSYKEQEAYVLKEIFFHERDEIRNVVTESIESIKRFIDKSNFGSIDFVIKEIARFEYDITRFLFLSEVEEQRVSYPIDVYTAVKCGTLEGINESITVQFKRLSRNNINVAKVYC